MGVLEAGRLGSSRDVGSATGAFASLLGETSRGGGASLLTAGAGGATPISVCLRSGFSAMGSSASATGAALSAATSERSGVFGAMPSRVCLRSGFSASTSGVPATGAVVEVAPTGSDVPTTGVSVAADVAVTSGVAVALAGGVDATARGTLATRGGDEARAAGAGFEGGRGAADGRG